MYVSIRLQTRQLQFVFVLIFFKKTLNGKNSSKNEKKGNFIYRILYRLRKSMARKKSGLMITLNIYHH